MSFQRKWVSDTNLSKLLHETIEKRQANKQRRSPDFCKDAMLRETIKKISSAMSRIFPRSIDLESADKAGMDFEENDLQEDNEEGIQFSTPGYINDDSWENDEKVVSSSMVIDEVSKVELCIDLKNIDKKQTVICRKADTPISKQTFCSSPKRKRHSSLEGNDYCPGSQVSSRRSPFKRRKQQEDEELTHTQCNGRLGDKWEKDDDLLPCNFSLNRQRSQSLPHLATVVQKDQNDVAYREKKLPVKSVVNSISELSLTDRWESNENGSWCLDETEAVKSDPLELNEFFHELKSVPSS